MTRGISVIVIAIAIVIVIVIVVSAVCWEKGGERQRDRPTERSSSTDQPIASNFFGSFASLPLFLVVLVLLFAWAWASNFFSSSRFL